VTSASGGLDERRLAVGAVRALAVLGVPVVATAAFIAGSRGALSALVGLGFVLLLFGSSALLLARVAAHGEGRSIGLMVSGSVVRIALYLVVLNALGGLAWIHGRSLAAATAVAVAVTLAYELRLVANSPRLFWIDADARRPHPVPHATRSESL